MDKISQTTGSFVGEWDKSDNAGVSVTALADFDDDCLPELLVGANLDDQDIGTGLQSYVGGVWLLSLGDAFNFGDAKTIPHTPTADNWSAIPHSSLALAETPAEDLRLNLFPNPTSGLLNIVLENVDDKLANLSVYNLFGKEIMSREITTTETTVHTVDMSQQTSGQYLVKLTVGDQTVSKIFTLTESDF